MTARPVARRGVAGIGVYHMSDTLYETEIVHEAERFSSRVISDCHFAVQLNQHFIPGLLSYPVAIFLTCQQLDIAL
jgi:hypothetical protein